MVQRQAYRRCDGFSLFELLVVMALIAVMAAFVLPRIGGNPDRLNFKTAVKDVASLMRYARNQAVTRGRDFAVVYEVDAHQIVVMPADSDEAQEREEGSNGIKGSKRVYSLPHGVKLDLSAIADDNDKGPILLAVFFSLGNSTGARVTLTDHRKLNTAIDVDLITGSVQVVE